MIKLNLDLESGGRPFKEPKEKHVKFFKVYCSDEEYEAFRDYCEEIGVPISRWFGDKMRRILRTVNKREQKRIRANGKP